MVVSIYMFKVSDFNEVVSLLVVWNIDNLAVSFDLIIPGFLIDTLFSDQQYIT